MLSACCRSLVLGLVLVDCRVPLGHVLVGVSIEVHVSNEKAAFLPSVDQLWRDPDLGHQARHDVGHLLFVKVWKKSIRHHPVPVISSIPVTRPRASERYLVVHVLMTLPNTVGLASL